MAALFWIAIAFLLYNYAVFPALVVLRGLLWPRPHRVGDATPDLSVILAAHNEADYIANRLDNLAALDYPREKIEVIVASDGSTDATEEIVRRRGDARTRLLSLARGGKGAAVNRAAAEARGEILVFTDANTAFAPDAVRALVRPFADPEVGGVAGDQIYLRASGRSASADGERLYWSFDRAMKDFQSRAGSVTSATGAIYAIRRSLFQPVPAGAMDDFIVSTGVVAQGYRLVFAPEARAMEPVAAAGGDEFQRKIRVATQGLHGVWIRRSLLNPLRYGAYAWQLLSHKVLRRCAVLSLLVLLGLTPWLWSAGPFYRAFALGQGALYGLAVAGFLLRNTRLGSLRPLTIPGYFAMVNAAMLIALSHQVRGRRITGWEPERVASRRAREGGAG